MLLAKALARLIEVLLMAALALLGLGVGLYCLSGLISLGSARPDRLLHLPVVRRHVGHFLAQLTAPGPVAVLALLGGVVAILLGLIVLFGILGRRREKLLVVERDDGAGLYVRPRALRRMVREQTERAPGVTGVRRAKVRISRSGQSGRVRVLATRGPDPDSATVDSAVHANVDPVTEQFGLRNDIRVKLTEPHRAHEMGQVDG